MTGKGLYARYEAVTGDLAMWCPYGLNDNYCLEKLMDKEVIPPRIEWVKQYVTEQGYMIDSDEFYDYHESRGWRVGKLPMRNWQAAVRTWVRNQMRYSNDAYQRVNKGSNHAKVCQALQGQIWD